ncbi:hypothetical protein, partial [Nocardia noduli]|uniref:hypothetical protein n=1 Tax=Nocardia noduli TaxID=2815722 RepID=UPI001C229E9B
MRTEISGLLLGIDDVIGRWPDIGDRSGRGGVSALVGYRELVSERVGVRGVIVLSRIRLLWGAGCFGKVRRRGGVCSRLRNHVPLSISVG